MFVFLVVSWVVVVVVVVVVGASKRTL